MSITIIQDLPASYETVEGTSDSLQIRIANYGDNAGAQVWVDGIEWGSCDVDDSGWCSQIYDTVLRSYAGNYQFKTYDDDGFGENSRVCALTVDYCDITTQPINITATEGDTGTSRTIVLDTVGFTSSSWYKMAGSVPDIDTDPAAGSDDDTSLTLSFTDIQLVQAGSYYCDLVYGGATHKQTDVITVTVASPAPVTGTKFCMIRKV
jgi:hypothetical protein